MEKIQEKDFYLFEELENHIQQQLINLHQKLLGTSEDWIRKNEKVYRIKYTKEGFPFRSNNNEK